MANELCVGDIVQISADATYFTGKPMIPWVQGLCWEIKSISGERVVLGKSADGHYNLDAPINAKYLTKLST